MKNLKLKRQKLDFKKTTIFTLMFGFAFLIFPFNFASAASPAVRIKDIAHILEARENQLMGFGLVVGLKNSGDKSQTGFTQQALTNLLSRMGVVPQSVDFRSRNVAAVMVTATLPPFVKAGQKLDVTVSSVGDATSLQGGTLLSTPLQGVDDQVYAVALGNVSVGLESNTPAVPFYNQQQATVGRITDGALVEKEVPVTLGGKGALNIVIDSPDFTTANRVVESIRRAGLDAAAKDAGTITVPSSGEDVVALVSRIENLKVTPDSVAKIVVSERTGTIVIGENVVISPVAVSYMGIDVAIGGMSLYTQGATDTQNNSQNYSFANGQAKVVRKQGKLVTVNAAPTLNDLVRALNAIGASPKDLIAILQAMKNSGAIKGELEII
jgi:flagellar P-ring protein precursor FlgI